MSAQIIDGKVISQAVRDEVAREVEELKIAGVEPCLAVMLVGEDAASKVYVGMKEKKCAEVGIKAVDQRLPADTSQEDILAILDSWNEDPSIHGILVQLPLPDHVNEKTVMERIRPEKDADGFHPVNVGRLASGDADAFRPCTPAGVQVMLKHIGYDPAGKHAVIVGRSNIVGRPMAAILSQKAPWANATVTMAHSRSQDLGAITRSADLLIVAVGWPNAVTADMVSEGTVVIDVGVNRVDDDSRERGYRLVGDVAYDEVAEKASWITPVPGGVGPMTIAMILKNTVSAARRLAAHAGGEPAIEGIGQVADPGRTPATAVPVAEVNEAVREVLESSFEPLWVRGEIGRWRRHGSGHCYFALRDRDAQIDCVMFRSDARGLPTDPDDGMEVCALGRLTLYPAGGKFQLVVRALEARGEGLWRLAFERLRAVLSAEGLLDPARKRDLPAVPRRVGVVTSRSGAALRDIIAVVRRRAPWTQILLSDCRVQGREAAPEIVAALERIGRDRSCDVVIVTRGGGSVEDLWAFNEESVARAIAACPIPVVSAVGHEIDFTIADLVADVRAPTPSAAAEMVAPELGALLARMDGLRDGMVLALREVVGRRRDRTVTVAVRLVEAARESLARRTSRLSLITARLEALSPLATLSRGYAVPLHDDGTVLRRGIMFEVGGGFDLRVVDATIRCVVRGVEDIDVRAEEP